MPVRFMFALSLLSVLACVISPGYGIYNGKRVLEQDVPKSFVHFGTYPKKSSDFLCGGILITWGHVLTSARCNVDSVDHYAYIGGRKLFSGSTPYISAIRTVEPYKHFQIKNGDHDLALVELRKPSRTAMKERGITPVNIHFKAGDLPVGTDMLVYGFGYTKFCDGDCDKCGYSDRLRMAAVTLQANEKCQGTSVYVNDDERKALCLNGDESTICKGDFGGPVLTYRANDQTGEPELQLVAIASTVVPAYPDDGSVCYPGAPIVGMGLQRVRSWIRHKTGRFARW